MNKKNHWVSLKLKKSLLGANEMAHIYSCKGACQQTWQPAYISRTHMIEEESQLPQVVF